MAEQTKAAKRKHAIEKAAGSMPSGPPGSKLISLKRTSPGVSQACTNAQKARIINTVPSKEQETCGSADTGTWRRQVSIPDLIIMDRLQQHYPPDGCIVSQPCVIEAAISDVLVDRGSTTTPSQTMWFNACPLT
jgi:hypothetical protein